MAELHDKEVTEKVSEALTIIMDAARTVDSAYFRLKVLTGAAAMLLELAKRTFTSFEIAAAFHTSKTEMRKAARQAQGKPI